MKAVIYARYSSDSQREESIEGQLRECAAFAEKNGITVLRHYIDRAYSAKTDNRPEFQQMIKDSEKRLFDIVLVWKLDRFARNRYDSARYKAQLRKNGVKVISANENISEGSEGIILESVLEGMAEYYSADLSEKVIRGLTENAIKCKFNSDPITFGFNFEPAAILGTFVFRGFFYARILLFTAVFGQSFCVLCKISFILFKVYSVGTPMPMSFVPIKITRFFGFMFKALHSSLSNNLSLSTANNPAPIAPQNSGLSDMKIFVFNRFCNTFFKNVFSGR